MIAHPVAGAARLAIVLFIAAVAAAFLSGGRAEVVVKLGLPTIAALILFCLYYWAWQPGGFSARRWRAKHPAPDTGSPGAPDPVTPDS